MCALNLVRGRDGYTLIQVVIASGLIIGILVAMTSMFGVVQNETRAIAEKVSVLEVQRELIQVLKTGAVCSFMVTNAGPWLSQALPLTIDTSTIGTAAPPTVTLNRVLRHPSAAEVLIQTGLPVDPTAPSVVPSSIQIKDIVPGPTANLFSAVIEVTMDGTRMLRAVRPISAHVTLLTSGAGAVKTITGCMRAGGGARTLLISELDDYHSGCGPSSGFNNFVDPTGTPSSGMLATNCFIACDRYCTTGCTGSSPPECTSASPGLGFSGGTLGEYGDDTQPNAQAECVCMP